MAVPGRFAGKVAVVTGAGQGIGRAIALRLASEGATIAAAGRTMAKVREAADAVQAGGGAAEAFHVELADVDSVRAMVSGVAGRFGRIDVLVTNAADTGTHTPMVDVTQEEWDRVFAVNARGTFFCLQAVARRMIESGGGRVVNLSSTAGKAAQRTRGFSYGASKGAIEVMTRLAAIQLAPHRIAVNAVCPGSTRAGAYLRRVRELAEQKGIAMEEAIRIGDEPIPIGRSNEPDEVATLVAFLATDDARNITGQSWNIDGGALWGR